MFITYLRRELRRRMRQATFIALGLALGIGLVITVTAASAGVSSSQGTVLHSLYGVGTDVTVTQTPTAGSGGPARFGVGGGNSGSKPQSGTSFSRSVLTSGGLGTLKSSAVTATSGLNFSSADATSNVAVVDANYAKAQNLKTGSTVKVAGTKFTVTGIVSVGQGSTAADVYIPLARAQALAGLHNEVNTIYVAAASAADISAVSGAISAALPKATVTTSSDLASEVTGSLASASSLANNL